MQDCSPTTGTSFSPVSPAPTVGGWGGCGRKGPEWKRVMGFGRLDEGCHALHNPVVVIQARRASDWTRCRGPELDACGLGST